MQTAIHLRTTSYNRRKGTNGAHHRDRIASLYYCPLLSPQKICMRGIMHACLLWVYNITSIETCLLTNIDFVFHGKATVFLVACNSRYIISAYRDMQSSADLGSIRIKNIPLHVLFCFLYSVCNRHVHNACVLVFSFGYFNCQTN